MEAASSGVRTTVERCFVSNASLSQRWDQGCGIPCLGLKRSLPNVLDLGHSSALIAVRRWGEISYLNEMPYCDTVSKPLFQTSVTSQALVAERRHDRKAETALPPTAHTFCVSESSMADDEMNEEACVEGNGMKSVATPDEASGRPRCGTFGRR